MRARVTFAASHALRESLAPRGRARRRHRPRPVGEADELGQVGGGQQDRPEHARGAAGTGWSGGEEAGVAAQRGLDGRPGQSRAGLPAPGDGYGEQGDGVGHARGVVAVGAQQPGLDAVEGVAAAGHARPERRERVVDLPVDVEPGDHEGHLVVPAGGHDRADLDGVGRHLAAGAGDPDAVGAVLGQPDRVEARDDVGREVARPVDLVEQLRGDRLHGDRPAGAGGLGDHRGPVGRDLGDGQADVPGARELAGEREVAAGGLRAALDDVSGDDRAGQRVEVAGAPPVPPRGGPDDHRGVGDPPGDDDVRAGLECGDDPAAPEVGVRDERFLRDGLAGLQVRGLFGRQADDDVGDVVAADPGDTRALVDRRDLRRAARGVEPSGVGDDEDPGVEAVGEHVLHLAHERGRPAALAALALLGEQAHRQLGEPVAGEDVDVHAPGEVRVDDLARGGEPVAVEAGDSCDGDHSGVPRVTSVACASTYWPTATCTV